MSSSPLAPKLKAAMSSIKEIYLDGSPPGDAFEGLLQMELALRGVIPVTEKLWQLIPSAIGKPLLTVTQVPPALLAGAHVLAGRLAEALSHQHPSPTTTITTIDAAVQRRAKDLQDIRWILLFQQSNFPDIARGYFYAAAHVQKDTPPMWKKVWDGWNILDQQGDESVILATPFEAQVAIQNLIRIASDKGNVKRVAELQLRLVGSYLNPTRIPRATITVGKEQYSVAQVFGDQSTHRLVATDTTTTTTTTTAKAAEQVLESLIVANLNTESDQYWVPMLQVKVGLAMEDAQVEQLAQEQHKTNQNRSVPSSLETCRSKIRTKMALDDQDPLRDAGLALRDFVVTHWCTHPTDLYWMPTLETLQQYLQRLQARALAKIQDKITRDTEFRQLLLFLAPLIQTIQEDSQSQLDTHHDETQQQQQQQQRVEQLQQWLAQISSSETTTLSSLTLTFAQVQWMVLANGMEQQQLDDNNQPRHQDTLLFLMDLVTALIRNLAPQQETQKTPAAVGATNPQDSIRKQWQVARSMLACLQGSPTMVPLVTKETLATTQPPSDNSLSFLRSMVVWSGWYQRPWAFCSNISDARRILALAQNTFATNTQKRPMAPLESILLQLATADAELLNGGFTAQAQAIFTKVLASLDDTTAANSTVVLDTVTKALIEAHCHNGLARIGKCGNEDDLSMVHDRAQTVLTLLEDLQVPEKVQPFYFWHDPSLWSLSIVYQRSVARQLIADSLSNRGQLEEARSFLEAAVHEAPQDPQAALALGAFLLRMAFYTGQDRSPDDIKMAQTQLLKAAKLDPTQADPFALLGVWFEISGDSNRAMGCFTKGLALDPCNPVAGRGLLRLRGSQGMMKELEIAIDLNSPVSGWAWRALGLESEDEFAVVSLLKALRSRDVSAPGNEALGMFFHLPHVGYVNERADALAELALCYRRLGRFTASIRAFHAAIESTGEYATSSVLCACAQVELELSLFDEAVEKFERVLLRDKGPSHAIAAYGQGVGLYHLAQRDLEDGKMGSAKKRITRAIESCQDFSIPFGCTRKLLGDLYSFGALLPTDLFLDGPEPVTDVSKKLEFVRNGETTYRSLVDLWEDSTPSHIKGSTLCDVGTNILLQAQIVENSLDEESMPSVTELYKKSRREYEAALEIDPLLASAWCGFGCSVVSKDPLLAQHAFSRSLQIQQMFPDAYANLGFLFTSNKEFHASESVMNALTQVADTPMMWINRAFILERTAKSLIGEGGKASVNLSNAADAYRAAMQVMKHSASQLGLAMTCRVQEGKDANRKGSKHRSLHQEALALTKEYNGKSVVSQDTVTLLEGVLTLEQVATSDRSSTWTGDALAKGESLLAKSDGRLNLRAFNTKACTEGSPDDDAAKLPEDFAFPGVVSLQRQILHEPDRPDLWLQLAKSLLSSSDARSAVESAAMAAERVVSMLTDSLIHPHRGKVRIVPLGAARTLADGLTMIHWLESHASDSRNARSTDLTREQENMVSGTPFALERALMIDPANALAREALKRLS